MRRSISRSPGKAVSASTGIVLIYGVLAVKGMWTPSMKAFSCR